MSDSRSLRRNLTRLGGGVLGLLLVLGFIWFVQKMMSAKTNKETRQVQVIQVIRPPPPPPPDQPPPPPPQKTEQPLPKDEPEPAPDNTQAPPDQPLGLDAEGSAGSDAFGLAARRGGGDLIGGTGSAPFAYYTNKISDVIRDKLANSACAKAVKGSLSIHVQMEADGRIKQIKLASSTGNTQWDACIESALSTITRIADAVPLGMPEQVNFKIVPKL